MRSVLLSLPAKLQIITVVGVTMIVAFIVAGLSGAFFELAQLKTNTDLISSVYEVMGTVYAILLTFTLWGVWQSYTETDAAVQNETFALLDLVHIVETSTQWTNLHIREIALTYVRGVINKEWGSMKNITNSVINIREHSQSPCMKIVHAIQSIQPDAGKDLTVFSHALTLLASWLDARRSRLLMARGNKANALWPLLLVGAIVLFSFHGLFVTETVGIWIILLTGISLVIGLTFYLIFTLDCPFAGSPSIDSEPFQLAVELLSRTDADLSLPKHA
jgi:hypothetical protein